MPTRIAIDAMGGDHAPRALVRGAVDALRDEDDLQLLLVGDETRIREELAAAQANGLSNRISVTHASEVVRMEESPIAALRARKDSSVVRMVELAAAGEAAPLIRVRLLRLQSVLFALGVRGVEARPYAVGPIPLALGRAL